jgi:hypothetical protein
MGIFRDLTQEEKECFSEKKAQVDSLFLADDVMIIFESIKREFKSVEISETDSFKKLILTNVNYIWENDLPADQKRYYYQNLGILISTPEQQNKYLNRLISLAADDVVKRFYDYSAKHKEVDKVVVKY